MDFKYCIKNVDPYPAITDVSNRNNLIGFQFIPLNKPGYHPPSSFYTVVDGDGLQKKINFICGTGTDCQTSSYDSITDLYGSILTCKQKPNTNNCVLLEKDGYPFGKSYSCD